MPKESKRREFTFSNDELREIRLALALRIARLSKMDGDSLSPSQRAKVQRHLEICNELHDVVRKARSS